MKLFLGGFRVETSVAITVLNVFRYAEVENYFAGIVFTIAELVRFLNSLRSKILALYGTCETFVHFKQHGA